IPCRKSRSMSTSRAALFFTTLAIARAVYVVRDEPRGAVAGTWIRVARGLEPGRAAPRGGHAGAGGGGGCAPGPGPAVPALADRAPLRRGFRRHHRERRPPDEAAATPRRRQNHRNARAGRCDGGARRGRGPAADARRLVAPGAGRAAAGLERSALRARVALDRLRGAGRRALYPDESAA